MTTIDRDDDQVRLLVRGMTEVLNSHPVGAFTLTSRPLYAEVLNYLKKQKQSVGLNEQQLTNYVKNTFLKKNFAKCPKFLQALSRCSATKIIALKSKWHESVQAALQDKAIDEEADVVAEEESDPSHAELSVDDGSSDGEIPSVSPAKKVKRQQDDRTPSKVVRPPQTAQRFDISVGEEEASVAPVEERERARSKKQDQIMALAHGLKVRLQAVQSGVEAALTTLQTLVQQADQL